MDIYFWWSLLPIAALIIAIANLCRVASRIPRQLDTYLWDNRAGWKSPHTYVTVFAILCAISSIAYTAWWHNQCVASPKTCPQTGAITWTSPAIHLLLWTLGPPTYFVIDFWIIWGEGKKVDNVDRMKAANELTTKFWAAVALLLAAIYKA